MIVVALGSSLSYTCIIQNQWYSKLVLQISANMLLWQLWNEQANTENLLKKGPQVIWVGTDNSDVTTSWKGFKIVPLGIGKKPSSFLYNQPRPVFSPSCFSSLWSLTLPCPLTAVFVKPAGCKSWALLSQFWTSTTKPCWRNDYPGNKKDKLSRPTMTKFQRSYPSLSTWHLQFHGIQHENHRHETK